jgi:hypothetical protein
MAKAFSLASWNVEHWTDGDAAHSARVVDFLASRLPSTPDVFAILEVEGKDVYSHLMKRFPDHRFHQSEGKQLQEILVGVHKRLPAFVTQRIEFKSQVDELRPGVLVTVTAAGKPYTVLFLHTKSGSTPYAHGLRYDMFENCFALGQALDKAAGGKANFLFLGDLNTMGSEDFPYSPVAKRFTEADEVAHLSTLAGKRGMRLLTKDAPATWANDPAKSTGNLDHVVASAHLAFKPFAGGDVTVLGWPKLAPADQAKWIEDHSDHGVLYLEVQAA